MPVLNKIGNGEPGFQSPCVLLSATYKNLNLSLKPAMPRVSLQRVAFLILLFALSTSTAIVSAQDKEMAMMLAPNKVSAISLASARPLFRTSLVLSTGSIEVGFFVRVWRNIILRFICNV